MLLNKHCRNALYPRSQVNRFQVPDEFVSWKVPYEAYNPPTYTAPHIAGQVWADAEIAANFKPKWNQLDGNINRISHTGNYHIEAGFPLNPIGRTGLRGRGLLGRWGPNHAADPIVTRWKRTEDGNKVYLAGQQHAVLQMVAIQRHDNGMWAIPGGMVDPGERVSETLKREFQEEALNSCADGAAMLHEFFAQGQEIYKGYVDDYRNTDNAWIETVAYNFHDDTGSLVGKLQLNAGDDAANVRWVDLSSNLKLHANHIDIVSKVVHNLKAYF